MAKIRPILLFAALVILLSSTLPAYPAEKSSLPVWLIHDWRGKDVNFLRNYRSMSSKFHKIKDGPEAPSRTGLAGLNISGSAQFGRSSLESMKEKLGRYRVVVVDLRQESHGFINGLPVSWFRGRNQINWGKTLEDIEADEKARLATLFKARTVKVFTLELPEKPGGFKKGDDPMTVKVHTVSTERELCEELGIFYMRMPVPDYMRPSDKQVDRFVRLARSVGQDSWIYVHCEAGDGRTTTFLAMYDMMRNAKNVSMEDIMTRQWLLGGIDLKSVKSKIPWKQDFATRRRDFVEKFYQYCRDNKDNFKTTWTVWLRENALR